MGFGGFWLIRRHCFSSADTPAIRLHPLSSLHLLSKSQLQYNQALLYIRSRTSFNNSKDTAHRSITKAPFPSPISHDLPLLNTSPTLSEIYGILWSRYVNSIFPKIRRDIANSQTKCVLILRGFICIIPNHFKLTFRLCNL